MSEQSLKSPALKEKPEEVAPEGKLQASILPKVGVKASAETGYSSAPHSSDISGAGGASDCIWKSDEHAPEGLALRLASGFQEIQGKKSPKKSAGDSADTSKPEGTAEFQDKTSRLSSCKKSSPAKQIVTEASVQSSREGVLMASPCAESADEGTSPTKRVSAEETAPHKSKSEGLALRLASTLEEIERKKISMKSGDSADTSKSERTDELEDKTSKLRSLKKLSPVKQTVAEASVQSSQEGLSTLSQPSVSADEETSPTKRVSAEEATSQKSKSESKTLDSKLKLSKKQTAISSEPQQSPAADPGKRGKSTAAAKSTKGKPVKPPGKGSKSGLSLDSSKEQGLATTSKPSEGEPLETEQSQGSETRGKAAKTCPSKPKMGKSKSRSEQKAVALPSESSDAKTLLPEPAKAEKTGKGPSKRRSASKSVFRKAKSPAKPGEAATSFQPQQPSSKGQLSTSPHSSVSTADLAKKVNLPGLKHPKSGDKMPLMEEPMETSDSGDGKGKVSEAKRPGEKKAESSTERGRSWYSSDAVGSTVVRKDVRSWSCTERGRSWYSRDALGCTGVHKGVRSTSSSSTEKGRPWCSFGPFSSKFVHEDVRSTLSSSTDETATETSTISYSSSMQGGSESKQGSATSSDSLSHIPGVEEEPIGGASEVQKEDTSKRPVRSQKRMNVESLDSDEDTRAFRAVSGSPCKKVPPRKQDMEDSDKQ